MVNHTAKLAIPIFNATFPGCQAVFAFDNAFNRCFYAADALRVENMNPHPGGNKACCGRPSYMAKGYRSQCHFHRTIATVN